MISADTVLRQGQMTSVPTKDAVIFMDVASGNYLMLADTARDVWDLLDGDRTVGQIVRKLMQDFDVAAGECEVQVMDVLRDMQVNGMIEIVR